MASLNLDYKTALEGTGGINQYYRIVADYDTQGTLTSFVVRDLDDNILSPDQDIIDALQAESDYIYSKGGIPDSDNLSTQEYPSIGAFNESPFTGGGQT